MIAIGVLVAWVVMSLTVDLARLVPAVTMGRVDLRRSAESWLGKQLDRPSESAASRSGSSMAGSSSATS